MNRTARHPWCYLFDHDLQMFDRDYAATLTVRCKRCGEERHLSLAGSANRVQAIVRETGARIRFLGADLRREADPGAAMAAQEIERILSVGGGDL